MRVRSMDLGFIFRQKIREIDVTQSFPAQNWFEQVKNQKYEKVVINNN